MRSIVERPWEQKSPVRIDKMYNNLVDYKKRKLIRKDFLYKRFEKFLPGKELRKPDDCWNWTGCINKTYALVAKLAKLYKVSTRTIRDIKNNVSWCWIKLEENL